MKIGIAGAGAMGSIFAYFFSKTGIDTALYEKSADMIQEMKKGIRIIANDRTEILKTEIRNDPGILRDCGIIFMFIKTYDTEEALKSIVPAAKREALIVSLQNGIGNKEKMLEYFAPERVVYGSTSIGATRVDGSTIRLGGMGNCVIGGSDTKAVALVEEILRSAGIETVIANDPDTAVWKKAIINAGINPLGAILSIPNGGIIKNEYSLKLQEYIVREAVAVADSAGVRFNTEEMIKETRSVCERTAKNLCSMLQDVNAKRRTEIDSINGTIIKLGEKKMIFTPYNDAIYLLIKTKEDSYTVRTAD